MVPILLFIVDSVLISISLLLSYLIRYGLDVPEYNFSPYKSNYVFLALIYMLAFVIVGCFKNRYINYWSVFWKIMIGQLLGTLLGFALIYIFRSHWSAFPSSVFFIQLPVGTILIFLCNSFLLRLLDRIKKIVIVIGKGETLDILNNSSTVKIKHIDQIEELLTQTHIDEVLICKKIHDELQLNMLTFLLLKLKVTVLFSPSLYAKLISENITDENTIHYLATFTGKKSDCEEFLLRAMDITGSLLMLITLAPLLFFVSLFIKFTSDGPILYRQIRVSKDGRKFKLYKFRTMYNDAENKTGPILASRNDTRITQIGRFLRTTRIDEIPQLYNVLLGHMSLVGPRPERPYFVKRHKALREIRLAVKPGLTGFAQIRSSYDLHPKHKIKYDYLYIQKRSLLLNLYILFKTVPVILLKKGQ